MTREGWSNEDVEARYNIKNKIKRTTILPVELLLKMELDREVNRIFRNHKELDS